jgi:hypothetical protein
MPHLEVLPAGHGDAHRKWIVAYEGDPTPIATRDTREQAIAEAVNHGREFPEPIIRIYGLDGEVETMIIEPDHAGPAPRHGLGTSAFPSRSRSASQPGRAP